MTKTFTAAPHIGKMLRKLLDEKRLFQSAWSRDQGVNKNTVAKYFKKTTMQVATLFTICQVLKYNFIREIADQLPQEFPPHAPNPLQQRVTELEEENKMLKREIEIWKEAAGVKK
ncbi:MAG TPA: helix-turn-helix domain-containing protein [Bacteroidia bacterium]|nr:helix-turn-helix domain-containing protein [Bacteroidia bacterium]